MKKLFIILSLVLALSVPLTVFAATSDTPVAQTFRGWCGIDFSKLTDQQKTDLNDSFNKMMDLRKESINKMIENGTITKEQGDAAIKNIDAMIKYRQENGFVGGFGGRGMGRGFGSRMFYNVPAQNVPVQ